MDARVSRPAAQAKAKPHPKPKPKPKMATVPALKGKSLSQTRTVLTRNHLRLGKVTYPKHKQHHVLRVARQAPGAHVKKPYGYKINVTLK